ncbi:MAG: hypothetical protein ACE366_23370 [Bradymonadia bacterium]
MSRQRPRLCRPRRVHLALSACLLSAGCGADVTSSEVPLEAPEPEHEASGAEQADASNRPTETPATMPEDSTDDPLEVRGGPRLVEVSPAAGAAIEGSTQVTVVVAPEASPIVRLAAVHIDANGQPLGELAASEEARLDFDVDPQMASADDAVHIVVTAIDAENEMMHLRLRYPVSSANRILGRLTVRPVKDVFVTALDAEGQTLARGPVSEDGRFELTLEQGARGPVTLEAAPDIIGGEIFDPGTEQWQRWTLESPWRTRALVGDASVAVGPLTTLAEGRWRAMGGAFDDAVEAVGDHFGLSGEALRSAEPGEDDFKAMLMGCLGEQAHHLGVNVGEPVTFTHWVQALYADALEDGRVNYGAFAWAPDDALRHTFAVSCARWGEGPHGVGGWHLENDDYVTWLEHLSTDESALSFAEDGLSLWSAPETTLILTEQGAQQRGAQPGGSIFINVEARNSAVGVAALLLQSGDTWIDTWPDDVDPRIDVRDGEVRVAQADYPEGSSVTIRAEAIDLLGRSVSDDLTFIVDTEAPRVSVGLPVGGVKAEGVVYCPFEVCELSFSVEDATLSELEVRLDGSLVESWERAEADQYAVLLPFDGEGAHTVTITATDVIGHVTEVEQRVVASLSPPAIHLEESEYFDEMGMLVDREGRRVHPQDADLVPVVDGGLLRRWQSSWALEADPLNPVALRIALDEHPDMPLISPVVTARFDQGPARRLPVTRRPGGLWRAEITGPAVGLDLSDAPLGRGVPLEIEIEALDIFGRRTVEQMRFIVEVMAPPVVVRQLDQSAIGQFTVEDLSFESEALQALLSPRSAYAQGVVLGAMEITNPHTVPLWITLDAPNSLDVSVTQQTRISGLHLPSLARSNPSYRAWDIEVDCLEPVLGGLWINRADRFATRVRGQLDAHGVQTFTGGACEPLEAERAGEHSMMMPTGWALAGEARPEMAVRETPEGALQVRLAPFERVVAYRILQPTREMLAPVVSQLEGVGGVTFSAALQDGETGLFNHVPDRHCAPGAEGCPEAGPWLGKRFVDLTDVRLTERRDWDSWAYVRSWGTCNVGDAPGCGIGGRSSGRLGPIADVALSRGQP